MFNVDAAGFFLLKLEFVIVWGVWNFICLVFGILELPEFDYTNGFISKIPIIWYTTHIYIYISKKIS